MSLTFGSLFSGIGGIDLGLERAGMTCRWQVENDPFCQKVLRRHWPDIPLYGDIKEIDFSDLEPVDLICGGFPCQPVSAAGRQKAQEDERWLWPEFARAVRELQPQWVLAENVPALLSVNSGRAAQDVFGDLSAAGYVGEWFVLPASAAGAPHLRKRVFIVAHARHGQPEVTTGYDGLDQQRAPLWGRAVIPAGTGASGGTGRRDHPERTGGPGGTAAQDAGDVAHADHLGRDGRSRGGREGGREEPADGSGRLPRPGSGRPEDLRRSAT